MRVKIGDTWHEVSAETPIMVEFGRKDRENVLNMAPGCTKYACFADDDGRGIVERLTWME